MYQSKCIYFYIFTFNNISDLMVENNIWHMTTSTKSACVDALDEIDNNPLTDVWCDVGNDA